MKAKKKGNKKFQKILLVVIGILVAFMLFSVMSGLGTVYPILDFKSLYSLLSDDNRIVVVEKYGYGFSDQVDKVRDVDLMLEETRAALHGAGIEGPYILCPHSLSGLESLYWAQTYPDETVLLTSELEGSSRIQHYFRPGILFRKRNVRHMLHYLIVII